MISYEVHISKIHQNEIKKRNLKLFNRKDITSHMLEKNCAKRSDDATIFHVRIFARKHQSDRKKQDRKNEQWMQHRNF